MSEKIFSRAAHEQERSRRGIEKILQTENLPEQFKTLCILAYAGVKPLSQFDLPYRDDRMDRIELIRDALRSLGIPHEETIYSDHSGHRIEFSIARDMGTLEQMRRLNAEHGGRRARQHNSRWHTEYGKLLGFPPTAIDAFVHHRPFLNELPHAVRETELGRFYENCSMMRLSEAHWKEELKTVQKWMEAVRAVSPDYLRQMTAQSNLPLSGGR